MNREISDERIKRFDATNLKIGDTLLFCHDCNFQVTNTAMKPECPNCNSPLYIINITDEFLKLKNEKNNIS